MPKHTNIADLDWLPTAAEDQFYADVLLDTYDTAEDPSSPQLIYGPCSVRYIQYQEGGIDAVVMASSIRL